MLTRRWVHLTVAFVVAFFAVCFLWMSSYEGQVRLAAWGDSSKATSYRISCYHGTLSLTLMSTVRSFGYPVFSSWDPFGFHYGRWVCGPQPPNSDCIEGPPGNYSEYSVAISWLAISLLVLPACILLRIFNKSIARRRLSGSLCPICRYDLRATPDRCPECGKIPEWKRS